METRACVKQDSIQLQSRLHVELLLGVSQCTAEVVEALEAASD